MVNLSRRGSKQLYKTKRKGEEIRLIISTVRVFGHFLLENADEVADAHEVGLVNAAFLFDGEYMSEINHADTRCVGHAIHLGVVGDEDGAAAQANFVLLGINHRANLTQNVKNGRQHALSSLPFQRIRA